MTGVTNIKNENGFKSPHFENASALDRPSAPQTHWVFELEDDGTVIYSRPQSFGTADELEGHNFFDESLGFEDISRCRHHFRSFINSNKAAASYTWRCSSAGRSVDAKVLMTRAYRSGHSRPTGVVMMEIRGR